MKRKKSFLKKITLLFVLFFLIHVGHTFVTNDAVGLPEKLQGFGTIKQEEHPIASDKYGWELVLVNRDNYIPDDYEMDLMELSNGQKIDSRIYPYLQEMFDDARNAGVYPFVRDGYRTAEEQQQILDDKITAYRSEGYTKHMAEETAMEWGALPGTSEHQLGLAVDINADTSKCSRDDVYNWLLENSYKYGFIQRYPSGKTSITGVANEPWHYRYVGKKQQRRFIRVECAWKNMWKILNRIKNFEYSILTAEILYPKAETTNVQMELKPLWFGLFLIL